MNNTPESEGAARREPGVPAPFIRRLSCWRRLRCALFVAACLATLIALFYAVENWRGRRAWEQCRRELEAKGEVIDWNTFIPAQVPDEQNIYKAPQMTEWFVKGSFANYFADAPSKADNAEVPFRLAPRKDTQVGPVLVAEVQAVAANEPLPPGKADAVLRLDDPAAPEQAVRLILQRIGPCVEGASACTITARPLSEVHPVYLVVQADKAPSAKELAEFLPRGPVPNNVYGAYLPGRFQVEPAGSNGFLVSVKGRIYTAAEYLELSQPAVPDLDVLRQALERPLARMDGNYQRPYDRPVENFVRLRTVAQMLSQRAQCCLLLGQSEAAWHELALVRDMCCMLEAKPASDCPTLVQDMIDVAIGGLYVSVIQDGLRLRVWREPELTAMQKQLGQINFIPLLYRGFQAERAASRRTIEITTPAELKKLFAFGQNNRDLWDKLKDPTYLFLTFGPRGWLFQNMCAGALQTPLLLGSLDITNNQILPHTADATSNQVQVTLSAFAPYTFLVRAALPNFMKAIQTMARNQTLANEAYITCALERYRLARKEYPKTLEALVPQFAEKLPHDIIGGEPLKYERTADDRFELYSIGWNAKDDGGVPGKTPAEGDWVWP